MHVWQIGGPKSYHTAAACPQEHSQARPRLVAQCTVCQDVYAMALQPPAVCLCLSDSVVKVISLEGLHGPAQAGPASLVAAGSAFAAILVWALPS